MVKCEDCIFCFAGKCINPESDEEGQKVFPEYDGCRDGKKSTVGITLFQRLVLQRENNNRRAE